MAKLNETDKRIIEAAIALVKVLKMSPNARNCRRAVYAVNDWRYTSGGPWIVADGCARLALAVCREMGVEEES